MNYPCMMIMPPDIEFSVCDDHAAWAYGQSKRRRGNEVESPYPQLLTFAFFAISRTQGDVTTPSGRQELYEGAVRLYSDINNILINAEHKCSHHCGTRTLRTQGDVATPAGRQELYEEAVRLHPDINVLINNAGIQYHHPPYTQPQDWSQIETELQINLHAPIHLSLLFTPHLMKQKDPYVMFTTSGLSFVAKGVCACARHSSSRGSSACT